MAVKKKKPKDEIYIELVGTVNIISVFGGKKSKTPLKSETVLAILGKFLEDTVKEKFGKKWTKKQKNK